MVNLNVSPNKIEKLRKYVESINDLPTIPTIVYDILKTLEDKDMDITELVEMVFRDQVLTSRLIRMSNSALFGRVREVTEVRQAIITLGINRVRILVFSCSVINIYPQGGKQWLLNPARFWEHSFGCAIASDRIAAHLGYRDREKAYLGGLVHDLGELTMSLHFKNEFQQVINKARIEKTELCSAETAVFEISHCEFGEWLAKKWNFPAYLNDVVRYHHNPSRMQGDKTLVAIVSLADALCVAGGLGYGLDNEQPLVLDNLDAWNILHSLYPRFQSSEAETFLQGMHQEVKNLVQSIFK